MHREPTPTKHAGGGVWPAVVVVIAAAAIAFAGLQSFADQDAPAPTTGSVQVAGSESMRPVVTKCAEDFMARHPQSDIIVKGGGSGDGMAALLHGMVEIGMVSRDLSTREIGYAQSHGVALRATALARDGISIVANPTVLPDALDIRQLRGIFAGKVRNWREVGGEDADIAVFARAEGSGTSSLFGDRVLAGDRYGTAVVLLPTNEAIVAEVAARAGAIGYSDLGAAKAAGDRIKVLALRRESDTVPVFPAGETIRDGSYPLTRTLHFVTAGSPTEAARDFLHYCLGPKGQSLVQRAGYVAMTSAE